MREKILLFLIFGYWLNKVRDKCSSGCCCGVCFSFLLLGFCFSRITDIKVMKNLLIAILLRP